MSHCVYLHFVCALRICSHSFARCTCIGGAYLRVAIFWKLNLNFYVLAFSCLLSYALTLAGSMAFVAACSLF